METLKHFNEEKVERIGKYVVQGRTTLENEGGSIDYLDIVTDMDDIYIVYKLLNKDNGYSADYVIDVLKIYSRVTIFIKISEEGEFNITNSYVASAFDEKYNFTPLTTLDLLRQELRLEEAFLAIEENNG